VYTYRLPVETASALCVVVVGCRVGVGVGGEGGGVGSGGSKTNGSCHFTILSMYICVACFKGLRWNV